MTVAILVLALTAVLGLGVALYVQTGLVRASAGEVLLVTSMRGSHRIADAAVARGTTLVERIRTSAFEVAVELSGIHAPLSRDGHPVDVRAKLWLVCPTVVDDAVEAVRNFGAAGIGDPQVMQPIFGPALEAAILELVASRSEADLREHGAELGDRIVALLGKQQHGLHVERCELSTGARVTETAVEGPFR